MFIPQLGDQLQDAIRPSSYDLDLLAAIFGERVYDHHRSTVRPPHIQFHSPSKLSSVPSRPQYTQQPEDVRRAASPVYETKDEGDAKGEKQTKYYFQPSDFHYGDDTTQIQYPSSGELVPVAQPLGKPRQDSKFRLAIPSTKGPQTWPVGEYYEYYPVNHEKLTYLTGTRLIFKTEILIFPSRANSDVKIFVL